jgi:hypothetical protein
MKASGRLPPPEGGRWLFPEKHNSRPPILDKMVTAAVPSDARGLPPDPEAPSLAKRAGARHPPFVVQQRLHGSALGRVIPGGSMTAAGQGCERASRQMSVWASLEESTHAYAVVLGELRERELRRN